MKKNYFKSVSSAQILRVSTDDLNKAFEKIEKDWRIHLEKHGITLPKFGASKWYQLAILKHHQKKAVHKSDISALVAHLTNTTATDQQVRHLKTQEGWFILNRGDSYRGKSVPDGCHVLITTKQPTPAGVMRRRGVVAEGDWKKILSEYGHACASCGTKIGERHRFDGTLIVESLEKGHMNPNKPLAPGNIIPQCRWCNRTARGDFTFDEQGRPRAIADVRPVKRADREVLEKVRQWLAQSKK